MRGLVAVTLCLILAANLQLWCRVNICIGWYILFSTSLFFVRLSQADVFVRYVPDWSWDLPVPPSLPGGNKAHLRNDCRNIKVVMRCSSDNWYWLFIFIFYFFTWGIILSSLLSTALLFIVLNSGSIHRCIYTTWKVHSTTFTINYYLFLESSIFLLQCFKIHRLLLKHRNYSFVMDSFFIYCDFLQAKTVNIFAVHLNCQLLTFLTQLFQQFFSSCSSQNIPGPSDFQPCCPPLWKTC